MNVAAVQNAVKERTRRPNLAVFVKSSEGVPMVEAIRRADEAGLAIAPNRRLSQALVGSDEWRGISEVFTCWTGTMTAYDMPGQKLGEIIEYLDSDTGVRYVFPVPKEQQGKKNIILVAQHPNVSLVRDGNGWIVQATKVDAVEKFPTSKEGWFLGDPIYDIPQGEAAVHGNQDARYLWRIGKRVGLVARTLSYISDYDGRSVDISQRPSRGLGVAAEAPEGGAPKELQMEMAGCLLAVRTAAMP